ncbi:helix-turn-helix domain-containing protein [Streptomyces sp. NPDC058430]|uniref:AraC family transcriptional regulator n=1 Tax=unclassified Streptomyces TaxID=2593676 RepID=UPI0036627B5E
MLVGREVRAWLDEPPRVASVGVGVHGESVRRETFRLPDLWQFHLYRYAAELTVDGEVFAIRPGHVSLVPPGSVVEFRYRGRSEHLYAHLELRTTGQASTLPVMQEAGVATPALTEQLQRAVAAAPRSPRRATAEVWAALWRVAELGRSAPQGGADAPHASVAVAIAYIESRLAEALTVPEVAAATGISHNHLIRLFRAETGSTVVAYIRSRRMARARHLLRESTLPISSVATAVGIEDLQSFNKACRREFGLPPRAIRAGAA